MCCAIPWYIAQCTKSRSTPFCQCIWSRTAYCLKSEILIWTRIILIAYWSVWYTFQIEHCAHCSFTSPYKQVVLHHTMRHHGVDLGNKPVERTLKCDLCEFAAFTKQVRLLGIVYCFKSTFWSCQTWLSVLNWTLVSLLVKTVFFSLHTYQIIQFLGSVKKNLANARF